MSDSPSPPRSFREEAGIPPNAISLFSRSMRPQIYHLPDTDAILKVGKSVKIAEADAMRFVSSRTSIPVPEVYEAYEKNGMGYILMSRVDGQPLEKLWPSLSDVEIARIADQLRTYIKELRDLRGDFYGALWNQPCQDIFFSHLCLAKPGSWTYGPFNTRTEYNEGLVEAITNSRPGGQLGEAEKKLISKIFTLTEDAKIFSHGDLHLGNILVDTSCNIVGLVDWGGAGFSIPGREYLEATLRARHPSWVKTVADIFPEDGKAGYDILRELDRALVLYSGF